MREVTLKSPSQMIRTEPLETLDLPKEDSLHTRAQRYLFFTFISLHFPFFIPHLSLLLLSFIFHFFLTLFISNSQDRRTATGSIDEKASWKHDLYREEEEEKPRQQRGGRRGQLRGINREEESETCRIRAEGIPFEWFEEQTKVSLLLFFLLSSSSFLTSFSSFQRHFGQAGVVQTVKIHYDKSGRPEGSAMVTFESSDDAQNAVESLNGIKGIEVTLAPAGKGRPNNNINASEDGGKTRRTGRMASDLME